MASGSGNGGRNLSAVKIPCWTRYHNLHTHLGFSRPNTISHFEADTRKVGRMSMCSQSGGREATCSVLMAHTPLSSKALTQLSTCQWKAQISGIPFTDTYLVVNFIRGFPVLVAGIYQLTWFALGQKYRLGITDGPPSTLKCLLHYQPNPMLNLSGLWPTEPLRITAFLTRILGPTGLSPWWCFPLTLSYSRRFQAFQRNAVES